MIKYRNLVLIGTSHIAEQSLNEVKKTIAEEKPRIVAVELDRKRLQALFSPARKRLPSVQRIGVKGFLFSLIGAWAEKKLGELVGVKPGSEMKEAVVLAKKNGLKVMLIDQDIEVTLQRFSKALSWKEKWNFIVDLFKAFVLRKKEVDFDLKKVPEKKLIRSMIFKVRQRYPNIYRVLIEERNEVMADRLRILMEQYPEENILAIVGAGHEEGILRILKERRISYSFSIGKNNI